MKIDQNRTSLRINEYNPKGVQGVKHGDEIKCCFAVCNDKTDVPAYGRFCLITLSSSAFGFKERLYTQNSSHKCYLSSSHEYLTHETPNVFLSKYVF